MDSPAVSDPQIDSGAPEQNPHQKRQNLGALSFLFQFLKPYRFEMAGALAALTVAAGTVLLFGMGLRALVDEGFSTGNSALLDDALIAMLGMVILIAIATYSRFYLVTWLGERVVADIRRSLYAHLLRLDAAFFEITKGGEILSRLTTDTTLIQTVIGSSVSIAARNFLMMIGGLVLLLVTSPKLTGLVLLVVPMVVLPILFFGRKVRDLSKDSQDRVADVSAHAGESLRAITTVQAFCHEDVDQRNYNLHVESAFSTAVKRIQARALLTAIVIVEVFGAVGFVLWIGSNDVFAGEMSAGDLSAFIFYAIVVAGSFGALSEVYSELARAAGAAERLSRLMKMQATITAPKFPRPLPEPAMGGIRFDQVSFYYPSRADEPALDHFSLNVEPGETVALVGPSGAGKSTVFQVLMRFFDPQFGALYIDGVDITASDPRDLRARLGIVPQDPVIFGTSAYENILYGRPEASPEEVVAAAEFAAAREFIEDLPEGFNTYLGEEGVRLSGGQKQRIAIARAILRNPAVMLLDEATSALDSQSERLVQQALERIMEGRTSFVIAHRLSTVLKADKIVVMDHGRIVAVGKHDELIQSNPLYQKLAKLQFGREVEVADFERGIAANE